MAVKLRLARHGAKKRPFYWIVAADERSPRDGRFLEKLGTYNPMLAKDDENRVVLNAERAKYWLGVGAQPTDRVAIFLGKAGVAEMPEQGNNPQKAKPKAAAVERAKERIEKEEARKAAEEEAKAEAAAAAPAEEETPAEEAQAEAPAEETTTEAPAEETTAEAPAEETTAEAPAEEAAAEEETKTE